MGSRQILTRLTLALTLTCLRQSAETMAQTLSKDLPFNVICRPDVHPTFLAAFEANKDAVESGKKKTFRDTLTNAEIDAARELQAARAIDLALQFQAAYQRSRAGAFGAAFVANRSAVEEIAKTSYKAADITGSDRNTLQAVVRAQTIDFAGAIRKACAVTKSAQLQRECQATRSVLDRVASSDWKANPGDGDENAVGRVHNATLIALSAEFQAASKSASPPRALAAVYPKYAELLDSASKKTSTDDIEDNEANAICQVLSALAGATR